MRTAEVGKFSATLEYPVNSKKRFYAVISVLMMLVIPWSIAISQTRGDAVLMKNGDRLTGIIKSITSHYVLLTTPFLGTLKIPRIAVKVLASDHPVAITNSTGVITYEFVSPNAKATAWIQTPVKPKPPVLAFAKKPGPIPIEKPQSIFGPHWNNVLIFGGNNTTGNTSQTQFSASVKFHYKKDPNEWTFDIYGAYGQSNDALSAGIAGTDVIYRGLLPALKPKGKWFAYDENHNFYDAIRGISFHNLISTGLGYYLIKQPKLKVDIRGGPGFLYERYFHGGTLAVPTASVGLRANYKFDDRVSLSENMLATQSLFNSQDYQAVSITAMNVAMPEVMRGFGVITSFQDTYDNTNLSGGTAPNDTIFLVGLTMKF